jgi:hypothetical protein
MLPFRPVTVYRPSRIDRGDGTYIEDLGMGRTAYAVLRIHEGRTVAVCDADSNIRPGDALVCDGAWYRVTDCVRLDSAPYREVTVERVERPIVPLAAEES